MRLPREERNDADIEGIAGSLERCLRPARGLAREYGDDHGDGSYGAEHGVDGNPAGVSAFPAGAYSGDYIRPCGFMRRKAETIQKVMAWYGRYGFDAVKVETAQQETLRQELLELKGIGEETADVILLYAFHKPVFVLDAYTRRMLKRLGGTMQTDTERRAWFMQGIPHTAKMYDDYHWLLLEHGKRYCKKRPLCEECPLREACAQDVQDEK